MTRRLAVAVVLFFAVAARAQTRGAVDWIFLVDTSKSMLENDVFGEVKKSLKTFVGEASAGDSVAIVTFDRDAKLRTSTEVGAKRDDLYSIIDGLTAEGNRTHLGAAIAKGLDRVTADPHRTPAIVLFTDGKEDIRGIQDPIAIDSNIERAQTLKPWLFFVSMNEHEEKLREFQGGRFIEANDALAIRRIARDIRKIIEEAKPAPAPAAVAPPPRIPRPAPLPPPQPPSPYRRIAIAAAAIALLLLIAFIARGQWKKRNELEGEIEIVNPRIDSAAAFVGLPSLKKTELVLSSILPGDALGGSDARLYCRHRDGEKRVWISAASGSLRVNDIEVPATELYDADTIQIGDAKLRFNRVGHERPQEDRP